MTLDNRIYYGDQTRWFIGEVTSISDPKQLARIQVRIYGIHSDNKVDIPDENLPYAQVVAPITEGGTNGLGNPLGIQVGALVFGIFLDGKDSQLPLVLGSMPKLEGVERNTSSVNSLARGTNTISKTADTVTGEPSQPYGAVYPNNKVTQTSSGHVIEIDDTSDNERIHIYHKSGTFVEMHPNGDVVTHTKNGFKTVTGNEKIHVTGDMEITVDGTFKVVANRIDLN